MSWRSDLYPMIAAKNESLGVDLRGWTLARMMSGYDLGVHFWKIVGVIFDLYSCVQWALRMIFGSLGGGGRTGCACRTLRASRMSGLTRRTTWRTLPLLSFKAFSRPPKSCSESGRFPAVRFGAGCAVMAWCSDFPPRLFARSG